MRLSKLGAIALGLAGTCNGASTACPASITIITVEREVHVGVQPVYISAFFSADTVIALHGTDIAITNAPTTFVRELTITNTTISTVFQ